MERGIISLLDSGVFILNIGLRRAVFLLTMITGVITMLGFAIRKTFFRDIPVDVLNRKMSFRIFIATLMLVWCISFIYLLVKFRVSLGI